MAAKTVLVIEDEITLQALIQMIVETAGYDPVVFGNGEQGLSWLREGHRPDIVFLDVSMPGKSGLQVLQEMQEAGLTETIPVVMLTGAADEKLMLRARQLGAKDILPKPFSPKQLVGQITKYLLP